METAEEFYNKKDANGLPMSFIEKMIEFAKMHCEAQAKLIAEEAYHDCRIDWCDPYDYSAGFNGMIGDIDREHILEIYPLTNIK